MFNQTSYQYLVGIVYQHPGIGFAISILTILFKVLDHPQASCHFLAQEISLNALFSTDHSEIMGFIKLWNDSR